MICQQRSLESVTGCWLVLLSVLRSACAGLLADARSVDVNSATPVSPYTNWATAAPVVQETTRISSI
jgi:hypothetical protein